MQERVVNNDLGSDANDSSLFSKSIPLLLELGHHSNEHGSAAQGAH